MCHPLCVTSEIVVGKCLGKPHGTKLHVLAANWKETKIILKVPEAMESHTASWQLEHLSHVFINNDFNMTKEEIMKYVSENIVIQ